MQAKIWSKRHVLEDMTGREHRLTNVACMCRTFAGNESRARSGRLAPKSVGAIFAE